MCDRRWRAGTSPPRHAPSPSHLELFRVPCSVCNSTRTKRPGRSGTGSPSRRVWIRGAHACAGSGAAERSRRAPCLQLELMLQLVDCLRQLHGCGIIHCDISPASVVRSATGILKLTDFSSARLCAPPDDGSSLLAARVATFPSRRVAYLAPEQLIQVAARTKHQILQRGAPPRQLWTRAALP